VTPAPIGARTSPSGATQLAVRLSTGEVAAEEVFETPLLRYRVDLPEPQRTFLNTLKNAVKEKVIRSARASSSNSRARTWW